MQTLSRSAPCFSRRLRGPGTAVHPAWAQLPLVSTRAQRFRCSGRVARPHPPGRLEAQFSAPLKHFSNGRGHRVGATVRQAFPTGPRWYLPPVPPASSAPRSGTSGSTPGTPRARWRTGRTSGRWEPRWHARSIPWNEGRPREHVVGLHSARDSRLVAT